MPDAATTIQRILNAASAPARSRTARYMGRVDIHLAGLPERQRAAFLRDEIDKWQGRYTAWAARMDSGRATDEDCQVTAFDFLETINALAGRPELRMEDVE